MSGLKTISTLILAIMLYFFIWTQLNAQRKEYLSINYVDYTISSEILAPLSLEFKGIVSDFLFLKMHTFLGSELKKNVIMGKAHAQYTYDAVNAITDLDPWFWDAYLVAFLDLSWEYQEYEKSNKLLFKARKYRTNDFRVPYYIAFNYFYFMKDNVNGAKYLMEASKLPGSPEYFPGLAAKLSMYASDYSSAILFLKDMIENTNNKKINEQLLLKLKTFIILDNLNIKVEEYKNKFNQAPQKLTDLIEKGIITELPEDPYGGEFYILESGSIYTTSNMMFKK